MVECASLLEGVQRCWTSGRLRFDREEAEQQRLWQAEQEAQAERDRQAAAAALAAKEAERRQLASLARRFALRLEGSVSIAKPPQVRTSPAWSGGAAGASLVPGLLHGSAASERAKYPAPFRHRHGLRR